MILTRLVCPHCSKQLRLKNPPVAGRRVLCSGCDRSFAFRPEYLAPAPAPVPAAIAPAPRPAPKQAPSSILVPVPPPPTPRPADAPAGRPLLLLGVVLGGLLFLAGGTALALFIALRNDRKPA